MDRKEIERRTAETARLRAEAKKKALEAPYQKTDEPVGDVYAHIKGLLDQRDKERG